MANRKSESQEPSENGTNEVLSNSKQSAISFAPRTLPPPSKKQKRTDARRGGFRLFFKRTDEGWTAKATPTSAAEDDEEMKRKKSPKTSKQEGDDEQPVAPKTPCKRRTQNRKPYKADPPPEMRIARVSKTIRAKIGQIRELTRMNTTACTVLSMATASSEQVVVPKAALLSALTSMYVDYEMGDATATTVAEVKDAIVEQHKQTMGAGPGSTTHFTVRTGLQAKTEFEKKIQKKIEGHGLDGVNLLAAELEIYMRQMEAAGADNLLRLIEDTASETDEAAREDSFIGETEMKTGLIDDDTSAPEGKRDLWLHAEMVSA